MASGWSDNCGGGIWWNTEFNYKNTIANQLFLHVAASLALRVEQSKVAYYKNWAEIEYKWLINSGLINLGCTTRLSLGYSGNCRQARH